MTNQIKVEVVSIEQVAPMIREFRLRPVAGNLSAFSPGAHVVVEMGSGESCYRNAYSLLSDPRDSREYRIAVRLQQQSRGGSRYMHQQVKEGDHLLISPPANLFAPQWQARHHLMLAGGVGITPFLAYLPELLRRQADFQLHYMFRGTQTGAYRARLEAELGPRCHCYDADQDVRCDLRAVMAEQPLGTHFYICGPESLLEAAQEIARELGIPPSALHWEAFASAKPGEPFRLELKRSGLALEVAADRSMLEVLEAAQVEVPNLCRGGVCGQCVCQVEEGAIDHRDDFLSDTEKASGELVMPCVSRAAGERLVLDL